MWDSKAVLIYKPKYVFSQLLYVLNTILFTEMSSSLLIKCFLCLDHPFHFIHIFFNTPMTIFKTFEALGLKTRLDFSISAGKSSDKSYLYELGSEKSI